MTMNPDITIHDAITGEVITREMTDEEYDELLSSGWTLEEPTEEGNTPEPWPDPTEITDGS